MATIFMSGVGEFHDHTFASNGEVHANWIAKVTMPDSNVVEFIAYPRAGVSISHPMYQAHIRHVLDRVSQDLMRLLISAQNKVGVLANDYDADCPDHWVEQVRLSLVRIPFEGPVELSLDTWVVNTLLFNGLDLKLSFDREWRVIKAWFDG